MLSSRSKSELEVVGFTSAQRRISPGVRENLLHVLSTCVDGTVRSRSGGVFAARGVLWTTAELRPALRDGGFDALASDALGHPAFPIDALFFDKHPDANWCVPAHQDRLMPVADTHTHRTHQRNGLTYAEPDPLTLSALLALRLHFDRTTSETGALCILPESQHHGILSSADILSKPIDGFTTCTAEAGDVLLMRPLALHRSSRATVAARRRVLHVVYATGQPKNGLRWRSVAA
jgi:hypothetical protein